MSRATPPPSPKPSPNPPSNACDRAELAGYRFVVGADLDAMVVWWNVEQAAGVARSLLLGSCPACEADVDHRRRPHEPDAVIARSVGDTLEEALCAAPPARQLASAIELLQSVGWDICPVVTPAALAWTDVAGLHDAAGHPVRSEFRSPDEPEFAPRGDAVLVAPATFNTINKCATGINDSLALGLINEPLGEPSLPLSLVPWVNASLSGHPARSNLALLQVGGAHVVIPDANDLASFDRACSSAAGWLAAAAGDVAPPS